MTGFIIFSIVEIRPVIIFVISAAAQFAKNPDHQNIKVVKTIL